MRVTCPHCSKEVTLPNEKAEQAVACPSCHNIFTAPALMNALPDLPSPPPPPPPPAAAPTSTPPVRQYTPPTPAAPPLSAPPRSASPGLDPCCRLTISKRVVHWIGPVALILLCVLSFFTWLAASPGGYPVYTQSAWSVAGGVFSPDITGEKVMNRETDLEPLRTIGWSMVLALLLSAKGKVCPARPPARAPARASHGRPRAARGRHCGL